MKCISVGVAIALLGLSISGSTLAADAEAAKALARQNNCFKCHAVSKDGDGPPYKKVAEKYKGKADAESKLIEHVTSGKKVKLADGTEEVHKVVKTSPPQDAEQVKNLVQWILSL